MGFCMSLDVTQLFCFLGTRIVEFTTKFLLFLMNYVKLSSLEKSNLISGEFEGG